MPHISSDHTLWKEVDGLVVVLLLSSGDFVELNKIGSVIWKLIAEGHAPQDIIAKMTQIYNVSSRKLSSDVHNFIAKCYSQGLLQK